MPKMCSRWAAPSAAISHHLADGTVEVAPLLALAHDCLEVFVQDDLVLHRVLDDRADQVGSQTLCVDSTRAEVAGLGPCTDRDRDRLGGGQGARRGLELELAIKRLAIAQLAEDGDDA